MSRLLVPARPGTEEIIVEEGLDWKAGDEIYLAPTAMQHDHSEYRVIKEVTG